MIFSSRTRIERDDAEMTYVEKTRVEADKPRLPTAPKILPRKETSVVDDAALAEYRKVAEEVGVSSADLEVELFRNFLAKKDMPTFNLAEVVKYMDDLCVKDNPTGYGWQWCPVRAKDAEVPMTFGRQSGLTADVYGRGSRESASDFYESHRFVRWHQQNMQTGWITSQQNALGQPAVPPRTVDWRTMPSPAYTRTIPLHALKKIAMLEREWTGSQIIFLVTDYVVAPHVIVNPDPFLMAVIPNSAVAHGKGRFIIDVWDEPGFGLDKQLIPA